MAKRDKRPTKAQLPAGSFRTTLQDGARVWVIEGRNFDSIKEYFQYRRDLALMNNSNSATATPKEEQTAAKEFVQEATAN